ncbi:porin family protein [Psychroserpens ponticola]|uniref:Porin family protein n=1 Tax=Psychroserpens ponticola TaxID=2932268 RepID=A0ABY7RX03_9FLAO|nr:porin family protein [Psychroserpens ponticola]WCO01673.1 porin family protein [Psychroserpens ponticola]
MQKKQFIVLVVFCIAFVTISTAQHKTYTIKNGIGLVGGLTQYDITTDNFKTKSGSGFLGGMIATVDIPHKWFTVSYGLQFSQNSIEIEGRSGLLSKDVELLEYDLMAIQLAFMLHVKLLSDNITLDVGPQLQYNGQLDLKNSNQEAFLINGYDALLAEDISDISPFNVNGVVGASAGIGNFKLRATYSYGFTNIFRKLNDDDNLATTPLSEKFEGNQTMLAFALMITF